MILRTVRLAVGVGVVLLLPARAAAQAEPAFAVTASLTTEHVLGLGVDYRTGWPIALIARAEGIGTEQAAGAGIRVIPYTSATGFEAYGIGMAGILRCRPVLFTGCDETGTSFGVAGGVGTSFELSDRWSAGLETMYWHSPSYDPTAVEPGQDDRFTVAGIFRLRL